MSVLQKIPPLVDKIFVIDDGCPEGSGRLVQENCKDPRITVLFHQKNKGVGAVMITGYERALQEGADIVVKIDGDGQMNPAEIPRLIRMVVDGMADYTKGNRFHDLRSLHHMPVIRIIGNSFLSFLSKISTGYWQLMDPTNGFTAIHRGALSQINLQKIDKGFFFESDLLFQLALVRAVVVDIPCSSAYTEEMSNLKPHRVFIPFLIKHVTRSLRRFFYSYLLRDFNVGSLQAIGGFLFLIFGVIFGGYRWILSYLTRIPAPSGTVMLAGMTVILGINLLISATLVDIARQPTTPLQRLMAFPNNRS